MVLPAAVAAKPLAARFARAALPLAAGAARFARRWWPYYAVKTSLFLAVKQYGVPGLYRRALVANRRLTPTAQQGAVRDLLGHAVRAPTFSLERSQELDAFFVRVLRDEATRSGFPEQLLSDLELTLAFAQGTSPANETAPLTVPTILKNGDPRLRLQSRAVSASELGTPPVTRAIDDCSRALAAFRSKHGYGRAISAPQVGHALRIVAFDLGEDWERYRVGGKARFTMLNPVLHDHSEDLVSMWDDCMSLVVESEQGQADDTEEEAKDPEMLMVRVFRHASCSVSFVDDQGGTHVWRDLPFALAELLQHECDHLDGILALDRAAPVIVVRGDDGDVDADADSAKRRGVVRRGEWLRRRDELLQWVDYEIEPTVATSTRR